VSQIYKHLYLEYLSTTSLVRALEEARRQLINMKSTDDQQGLYLWEGIAADILQELGGRQLKLMADDELGGPTAA